MQVPGAALQHQTQGNTAWWGAGKAEKGQLENKDILTREHLSGLLKSKTTVGFPRLELWIHIGGLHFTPSSHTHVAMCSKGCLAGGFHLAAWTNTCSGVTGAHQEFSAVELRSSEVQFSVLARWHPALWLVLQRSLSSTTGSHRG